MKRIGWLAAFLLVANNAWAGEKVRWVNDWVAGGDKAIVYIGVHKGFFAAEGLDVEIQSGRGSADAVTKTASGVADLTAAGIAALMQARAETGAPVKAIASIYTKQPDAIFTTAGGPIATLKDLPGRKVATGTFSSSNVIWPLVLEANKVDPARIELIKVDPPALAPMLAVGKVDGTVSWMTNVPLFEKVLAANSKQIRVIPWFDYGFEGYAYSLMASEKMIRERPETVRKFVRAYRKAQEAGLADPRLAAASVKALAPEIDEAVAEGQWKASIPLMVNEVSKQHGMGRFDPALLKETWMWVARSLNMPADKIDPQSVVDRAFLQ
jgi:NitT/TauT family transport system substrate-binding protein